MLPAVCKPLRATALVRALGLHKTGRRRWPRLPSRHRLRGGTKGPRGVRGHQRTQHVPGLTRVDRGVPKSAQAVDTWQAAAAAAAAAAALTWARN